ncbi:MAG: HNH endonuclease [Patescibacteria group bacterium]|nr:HNH endonuclease [Patescibacteria group bacterium]
MAQRREVLKRFGEKCVYCHDTADQVDHIIPWSFKHDDSEENLVAACWLCNGYASNKMFKTFSLKREYILRWRDQWLKKHPITLWLREDLIEMAYNLRHKIENSCLIFETSNEMNTAEEKLLKLGYRIGGKIKSKTKTCCLRKS